MNNRFLGFIIITAIAVFSFQACAPAKGESPGHEYMPDMAHAITYEANRIDEYSLHTWNKESVRSVNQLWGKPRVPVNGSIPRGYVGISAHGNSNDFRTMMAGEGNSGISTPLNGNVPYYYTDTEEERTRATKEIVMNPFPITKKSLAKGKELWIIYCGICHGEKTAGNGYLVDDSKNRNVKYPAQPANLLLDTFVNGNNGRLYHAIMYGKNVMGGYADKLSYEERWDVIHYIRSCQAEEKKLQYDEAGNTFKPTAAISEVQYKVSAAAKPLVKAGQVVEKAIKGNDGQLQTTTTTNDGGAH
jgi:cytochrome c553